MTSKYIPGEKIDLIIEKVVSGTFDGWSSKNVLCSLGRKREEEGEGVGEGKVETLRDVKVGMVVPCKIQHLQVLFFFLLFFYIFFYFIYFLHFLLFFFLNFFFSLLTYSFFSFSNKSNTQCSLKSVPTLRDAST